MDYIQDLTAVGGAILSIAVTWGVLKNRVAEIERAVAERKGTIDAMKEHIQTLKLDILKQRSEIQETFVTWKQFESFVGQIRAEQAEIKTDVKHILEILAKK